MTIIEGIGDEVTQFCLIVLCGIVAILAWWSTAQRPYRFRTAVILDRNVGRVYRFLPRPAFGRRQTHMLIISENATQNDSHIPTNETNAESSVQNISEPISTDNSEDSNSLDNMENSSQEPIVEDMEMNSIVNAMDSEASVLRNRRLAFFESRTSDIVDNLHSDSSAVVSDETHIPLNVKKEDDNIENTNKNDVNNLASESPEVKVGENNDELKTDDSMKSDTDSKDNIRIRLKYLNDDLKLVEGSLHELLGDFKRRHFKVELNARKLVRLIFNGQVLHREAATLESCGLFDNCVVHCLVHQPRTQQQFAQVQQQLSPTNIPLVNINNSHIGEQGANQIPPVINHGMQEDRDWDLSHILFTLLASLLSIAWYIHIRFSSLFGVPASLAMLGLTAIYIVAVICVYFSETQPVNNANNVNNVPVDTAETNNSN